MPRYQYECESCGLGFEETHTVDERYVACPDCGSHTQIIIGKVNYICYDCVHDPNLGYVGGPRERARKINQMGLVEDDRLPSEVQKGLPSPSQATLNSPEVEKEFMKIYEERACPSISVK